MNIRDTLLSAILFWSLGISGVIAATDTERQQAVNEIRALLDGQLKAHINGDANYMASLIREKLHIATAGESVVLTKEQVREGRSQAYAKFKFTSKDVQQPIIHVADSGDMAWAISVTETRRVDNNSPAYSNGVRNASVLVFEKAKGKWWLTAIGESIKPVR
jgi:ketosteroid isomerase-like protein